MVREGKAWHLYRGGCVPIVSFMESESMDACVTDPPYHLTSITRRFGRPAAASPAAGGMLGRMARGFMGHSWDGGYVAHDPETWATMLRAVKPGAWAAIFHHPRTYHRLAHAVEAAGWEIRDTISWLFATGAPMGNKRHGERGSEDERGTRLAPAHELILLARRPNEESSFERQHVTTGTGFLGMGACRVADARLDVGRFPSNVVVSHAPECETLGCSPGCPAYELGDRVKFFPTFRFQAKPSVREKELGLDGFEPELVHRVNSGGLENEERFAPVERRNPHNTVKPVTLMRWLVRLVTPPGGTVLDPFLGSGTTGMAALWEDRRFIGIEAEERYHRVAQARIAYAATNPPPPFACSDSSPRKK